MKNVIKHGKHYKGICEAHYIPYVKCPECNYKIYCDLDYPNVLVCKCGCEFKFENEDIEYKRVL